MRGCVGETAACLVRSVLHIMCAPKLVAESYSLVHGVDFGFFLCLRFLCGCSLLLFVALLLMLLSLVDRNGGDTADRIGSLLLGAEGRRGPDQCVSVPCLIQRPVFRMLSVVAEVPHPLRLLQPLWFLHHSLW